MTAHYPRLLVLLLGLVCAANMVLAEGFDTLLSKQKAGLWEMIVMGNVRQLCVTEKSKLDARDAVQNNPYCKATRQSVTGDNFEIEYACDVPGLGNVKMAMSGTSSAESFHADARYQLPPDNPAAQALAAQLQAVKVEGKWQRPCTDAEMKSADGLPSAPAKKK